MKNTYHKISLDEDTYTALQQRAHYIKQHTNQPISIAATIRWLTTLELNVKKGGINN